MKKLNKKKDGGKFPGGPVVRTPRFHCWGPGFDPKKKKEKKREGTSLIFNVVYRSTRMTVEN